jgi:chromosomal replication initiator protein
MRCDEHTARLGSIISELRKWESPDLVNLSHAIGEIVDRREATRQPTLRHIMEVVASVSGVSLNDLSSERRDRDVKRPRKVAMALCKHLTLAGYRRIGPAFGRESGSAWRSCRQLEPLVAFAGGVLPADATIQDWALIMLDNYERFVGAD